MTRLTYQLQQRLTRLGGWAVIDTGIVPIADIACDQPHQHEGRETDAGCLALQIAATQTMLTGWGRVQINDPDGPDAELYFVADDSGVHRAGSSGVYH